MMSCPRRALLAVVAVVAALSSGIVVGNSVGRTAFGATGAVAFNPNYLMSDAVFDATGTMSAADIQTFLNRFPKSCLRNYQSPLPLDYSTVGANASAAQVISASASMYGINPQVILATLEKEQSLVTGGGGCANWRYWSAMGYACPDGGATYSYPDLGITSTCVSSKVHAGFTAQVNHGAWQLQFNRQRAMGNLNWRGNGSTYNYGYHTAGTFQDRTPSNPNALAITYDGLATIDGSVVKMTNGVTASLYTYTPHLSANQSFVTLFTNWFGSPTGSSVVPPSPPPDPAKLRVYIDNVYRLFLGRTASSAEEDWWIGYVGNGPNYAGFLSAVIGSQEARNYLVAGDYVSVLQRSADSAGVAAWSTFLARTGRNDTVLANLAGSEEYFRNRAQGDVTSFVTYLYQDLLGRNVDPVGLSQWSTALNNATMTRTDVAYGLLQSQEYARLVVNRSYLMVLGRSADPDGSTYWSGAYQTSHRVLQVQSALAVGSEGVTYLSTLQ